MTGRAVGYHQNSERVIVAIQIHLYYSLPIAGGLTLVPQTCARTGPEPGLVLCESSLEAFPIHISERQHLERIGVLDNRRHQAVLVKFNVCDVNLHLTTTPRSRKYFFTSPIVYSPK